MKIPEHVPEHDHELCYKMTRDTLHPDQPFYRMTAESEKRWESGEFCGKLVKTDDYEKTSMLRWVYFNAVR